MIRAVSAIVAALEFVAPKFQHKAEASVHLQALAIEHDLDPFTIIAVVRNESGWQSGAINKRTGARGLGQIMPTNYRKCVDAPDGPECERIKADLLGWKHNLSETARTMATWRRYCNRRVGSELAIHWLPGYQGLDMRRGAICGHRKRSRNWVPLAAVPKLTEKVLAKRRELIIRFGKAAAAKKDRVSTTAAKAVAAKAVAPKAVAERKPASKTRAKTSKQTAKAR